jgi:hypothetical protein
MLSTTIERLDKVINCLQEVIEHLEAASKNILELKEWLGVKEPPPARELKEVK